MVRSKASVRSGSTGLTDLYVSQHTAALLGSTRIQLQSGDHPVEDAANTADTVLQTAGKKVIERRTRQHESDDRIDADGAGRPAPGAIELQYMSRGVFDGHDPNPRSRVMALRSQPHETGRSQTPDLIVNAPVWPARGGSKAVYPLLTGTGLNQAQQFSGFPRSTHRHPICPI